MAKNLVLDVSGDTIGRVAGEVCAELIRQRKETEYTDDEGNAVEVSLEDIAMTSYRLAVICCLGRRPEESIIE